MSLRAAPYSMKVQPPCWQAMALSQASRFLSKRLSHARIRKTARGYLNASAAFGRPVDLSRPSSGFYRRPTRSAGCFAAVRSNATRQASCAAGAPISTRLTHNNSPFIPATALNQDGEDPLIVAADRCIEVHTALGQGEHVDLQQLSETLLFGIGRMLAQRG